ncbi:hypothetical protein [Thiocapsa sp.]|uniref:COG4648 family protein n=1 Tax=Thiocapsa sp. TaxID=2024551 RepID=UPI0025F450D4|nr:hypothetical protein [Thiocapsa sp.]
MTLSSRVLTALAIAYPFVSHFGATLGAPVVPLLWLCLMLWGSLPSRSRSPALLALALACPVAIVIGHLSGHADLLLRLPPVIICFAFAWIFGRTLRPGHTALISRIGERMRGELPEPVAHYGHRLTVVWTLFFVILGLECILLGLFASPFWWSLFTNYINYALIALLLVLEYPIRRRVLRDLEHTPFIASLRGSLRLDLH